MVAEAGVKSTEHVVKLMEQVQERGDCHPYEPASK